MIWERFELTNPSMNESMNQSIDASVSQQLPPLASHSLVAIHRDWLIVLGGMTARNHEEIVRNGVGVL